jgi:hypothetical protein
MWIVVAPMTQQLSFLLFAYVAPPLSVALFSKKNDEYEVF